VECAARDSTELTVIGQKMGAARGELARLEEIKSSLEMHRERNGASRRFFVGAKAPAHKE
jgi:hypothetical protein